MTKLAIIALVASVLAGCVKNNPDPAWLEVNEWTLESNAINVANEGELTHNFTDAWVFIDNKLIGVFEVPFKIPVLVSGDSEITIYPTIKDNGIAATKRRYPFMEPYVINATLAENQTTTINPVTRYGDNVKITLWDFEDQGNFPFEETDQSQVVPYLNTNNSFFGPNNGQGVMSMVFTDANRQLQMANKEPGLTTLPKQGADVYLEMDYYNDLSIVTGVVAVTPASSTPNVNVQVNGQDPNEIEWKKIYIDLTTVVSAYPSATNYYLSFDALLPDSLQNAQINIDNMKVVHF